ncbi:MAG: glycosyltransferase family 4 protein [Blastocatellia bacterium]|nr:glycosyltransferase family 4 protein [Blastocatellia bacterium]
MRILQISSARTFGGGERHVIDLARGLVARGHEVYGAIRPTCEWQDRLDFLPAENVFKVSIRNSFGVLSAIRIGEFVRDREIEIVHAHVARDYVPASIACLTAKSSRFVITRHVMFPLKSFNRFALQNLGMAIGVSEPVGEMLRKIFSADKITVIPNGISVSQFDHDESGTLREEFRRTHGIPRDVPVVGTLGELKPLKGQRDLVLAAQEVVKEIPGCRFVVVGIDHTPDSRFRRELKRLVKVFGLEESFVWLDWVEETDAFFAGIDLFVSPSHSESFGLAILEAMAHGKPLVATETDGAKELLGDSEQLVSVNHPVQLANRVTELLGKRDRCRELGSQNRSQAGARFSLEDMVESTERVYKELHSRNQTP